MVGSGHTLSSVLLPPPGAYLTLTFIYVVSRLCRKQQASEESLGRGSFPGADGVRGLAQGPAL